MEEEDGRERREGEKGGRGWEEEDGRERWEGEKGGREGRERGKEEIE